MPDKNEPGRRRIELTEDQIDYIAEKAAEKAATKATALLTAQFFQAVGKGVITRMLTIVGAATIAFILWARSKGYI